MEREINKIICIMCPMGCPLEVIRENGEITVSGHTCKRGAVYGEKEITAPVRMVTSLVPYKGKVVSVRTSQPVAKDDIFKILKAIKELKIEENAYCGMIVEKNIAGSGADIILTANI